MNSIDTLGSASTALASKTSNAAKQQVANAVDPTLGLDWFALTAGLQLPAQSTGTSFAALFSSATNASASSTNTDPIAALTALVQNGTPISTIIDRLAQQLAGAVQGQLPGAAGANSSGQSSLAKTIANALAPPGNAPPGTALQQVTDLATRLQSWIAQIAGGTQTTPGQQNDIAGNLLDAKSAKDIPAQRKSDPTSTQADAALLAQALLGSVAKASLNTKSTTAATANASSANVALSLANAPAALASAPAALPSTPAATAQSPSTSASAPQITVANAPDLLARMLVRAASTDATINGASAQVQQSVPATGSDSTPSALAARFSAAIASVVTQTAASDSNANANSSSQGRDFSQGSDTSSSSQSTFGASVAANVLASNNAPVITQSQASQAPAVDANAVVEQIVKSMVMRTDQSGTSEVRLRLNPDNLGEVTMKLTITGSSISANVVAQNADVGNALLSNHKQLAQSLSQAGLTLSGFSVDVSGGDAGSRQNQDRTDGFGRRYVVHEIGSSDSTNESAQPSALGPQLLPGSSLELFNYLA